MNFVVSVFACELFYTMGSSKHQLCNLNLAKLLLFLQVMWTSTVAGITG